MTISHASALTATACGTLLDEALPEAAEQADLTSTTWKHCDAASRRSKRLAAGGRGLWAGRRPQPGAGAATPEPACLRRDLTRRRSRAARRDAGRGCHRRGRCRSDFLSPSDEAGPLGRLGHYEVLEVIGRGGMGIVLQAFDEKLHRVVAIKVMAPQLATSATARKRFIREAQAAAAVSHDHVVTIHAVEEADAAALPGHAVHRRHVAAGAARPRRAAGAAGDPAHRHADGRRAWRRPTPRG